MNGYRGETADLISRCEYLQRLSDSLRELHKSQQADRTAIYANSRALSKASSQLRSNICSERVWLLIDDAG